MNINTLTGFEKGRNGFSISLSIWFNLITIKKVL